MKQVKLFFIGVSLLLILLGCATTYNESGFNSSSGESKISKCENYYSSAIAYLGINNYELAKINFLNSLKCGYNKVGAYYYLGLIEYKEGNLKESEKYLQRCINLNNKITDAHNTLGAIYAKQKRYKEAIKEFKAVLEDNTYLFPENALYNLALIYYSLKDYDTSIKYCNKSLYIVPKSPAVYYLLALNYYQKGKIIQAKSFLKQIIKEFPNNIWATKAKMFMKTYKLGN